GPPLPPLHARADTLCRQPLYQRSEAPLWRHGQAAQGPCLPRRRLFDRRYRLLAVAAPARAPGRRPRRLSEPAALVPADPSAAGCGARPRRLRRQGEQRTHGCEGEGDPVRRHPVSAALIAVTERADLDIATRVAQALGAIDKATGALVPPVHTATTYVRDRDYQLAGPWSYGRPDNPTVEAAEAVLASIEGGAGALLFASGTAAFTRVFLALKPGDLVVAPREMYWALRRWLLELLQPWGVAVELVDMTDLRGVAAAMRPGQTRVVWIETPANPSWIVTDIAAVADIAH